MKFLRIAALVIASGASVAISANEPSAEVQAILTETLPQSAYTEKEMCVFTRHVKKVEVLDDSHILLSGTHKRVWLNRLAQRCLGLRPDMILAFTHWGSKMCRQDRVQARRRGHVMGGHHSEHYGHTCILGDFEPVDMQQAAVLRTAFADQRKRRPKQDNKGKQDSQVEFKDVELGGEDS